MEQNNIYIYGLIKNDKFEEIYDLLIKMDKNKKQQDINDSFQYSCEMNDINSARFLYELAYSMYINIDIKKAYELSSSKNYKELAGWLIFLSKSR